MENVYAQHVPLLINTLQSLIKGKLSGKTHPVVRGHGGRSTNTDHLLIPDEVIVFMVGGVTYEEATKVAEFNESMQGRVRVLLAGSTVHNSTSFLDELSATTSL